MGNNNCGDTKQAGVINQCSYRYADITYSSDGSTGAPQIANSNPDHSYSIYNFCTSSSTTSYAKDWCSKIGKSGSEWSYNGYYGNKGECRYNSCQPYNVDTKGCCHNCCGNNGQQITCKRNNTTTKVNGQNTITDPIKAFSGSPISCCFKDFDGCRPTIKEGVGNKSTESSGCFSNEPDDKPCDSTDCSGTCEPCLRDITSNGNSYYGNVNINTSDKYGSTIDISNNRCTNGTVETSADGKTKTTINGIRTCSEEVFRYCTGDDLEEGDVSWIYRWMNEDGTPIPRGCLYALARNIYYQNFTDDQLKENNPPRSDTIQTQCDAVTKYFTALEADQNSCTPLIFQRGPKFQYASDMVSTALETYQKDGYIFGAPPGSQGYSPFQDFMYKTVFCPFPAVADEALNNICRQYTTNQLEQNPSIANICGCYLSDEEYLKYTNVYQVNPVCSPMCNKTTVVPRTDFIGEPYYCNQDTCIIDDVAINLSKSQVGEISINEMCGNCHSAGQPNTPTSAGSSCNCNIDSVTYQVYGSDLDSITLGNQCTTSNCTVYNPVTNQTETMPCSEVSNQQNIIDQQQKLQKQQREEAVRRRTRNILIFFGILIFILFLIGYFLGPVFKDMDKPSNPKKSKIIIAKQKPKDAPMGSTAVESFDTILNEPFTQESYTNGSSFSGDSFSKTYNNDNIFSSDSFNNSFSFGWSNDSDIFT